MSIRTTLPRRNRNSRLFGGKSSRLRSPRYGSCVHRTAPVALLAARMSTGPGTPEPHTPSATLAADTVVIDLAPGTTTLVAPLAHPADTVKGALASARA